MSITEIEAEITELPAEEVTALKQWLAQREAQSGNGEDPLLKLLGTVESDVPDAAERHDTYLGQALLSEAPNGR